MVHTAAACADELLAIGQDFHKIEKRSQSSVSAQERQGYGNDQGRRRGEARGGRQVAFDLGVYAVHYAPLTGDCLSRGAEIVFPVAACDGSEIGSPMEF